MTAQGIDLAPPNIDMIDGISVEGAAPGMALVFDSNLDLVPGPKGDLSTRVSQRTIDFGSEKNSATLQVSDASITSNTIGIVLVSDEDLHIQGVQFDISDLVAGIGYTLRGFAPDGASGEYSVNVLLQEV